MTTHRVITKEKFNNNKSLMQRLLESSYTGEIGNYYSNLYIENTPLTQKVIDEWLEDNDWQHLANDNLLIQKFTDQTTGKQMISIALTYEPDWEEKYIQNKNEKEL